MPVIVLADDQARWLAGDDADDLLNPIASELLDIWPVGTAVNKVEMSGRSWGAL